VPHQFHEDAAHCIAAKDGSLRSQGWSPRRQTTILSRRISSICKSEFEIQRATVPDQPESSTPINKKQPLLSLLFIILLVFVVSNVVTASTKAAPLKSRLTARSATATPQQVSSFETQQEQTAKKDQEEQQQRAATAVLLAALQGSDSPGPESHDVPPMTAARRAAIYGASNPNAPQATFQMSERQAQARQAELAREKQRQDALNSDTAAVDSSRPVSEWRPMTERISPTPAPTTVENLYGSEPAPEPPGSAKSPKKEAALNKYEFDSYDGKLFRIFEGSIFEGVVNNHIDGGLAGPILIMLTTDYYSHDHHP
jgi:hypothetical protein